MSRRLSRRTFLGSATISAVALPQLAAAAANRSAANDITVAVMGVNGRGAGLARAFAAQPGTQVAYLCDVDRLALDRALQSLAGDLPSTPALVEDFRQALDDAALDALVIAAPDHWHAPAALLALAAGKNVYVEKPACHNGQEGTWMLQAAERRGRVAQVGTQRRSSPGTQEAIGLVRGGEIGRVLFARGWIVSTRPSIGRVEPSMPPEHLNYSLWQGPAPESPYKSNVVHYHWHWFWRWGTGELGNNGIHALDVCRWGLDVKAPTRVTCGGGRLHFDDDQETPDTQLATFHFDPSPGDPGQTAKVIHWEHRTWNKRGIEGDDFGVAFYGEQGSIVLSGGQYHVYDLAGELVRSAPAGYNDADHVGNFLAAIREQGTLNAPLAEGVASTALCHLGNIAYRVGRTVHFDGDANQITGDTEAAALWGREYRPGWEPAA